MSRWPGTAAPLRHTGESLPRAPFSARQAWARLRRLWRKVRRRRSISWLVDHHYGNLPGCDNRTQLTIREWTDHDPDYLRPVHGGCLRGCCEHHYAAFGSRSVAFALAGKTRRILIRLKVRARQRLDTNRQGFDGDRNGAAVTLFAVENHAHRFGAPGCQV